MRARSRYYLLSLMFFFTLFVDFPFCFFAFMFLLLLLGHSELVTTQEYKSDERILAKGKAYFY